MQIREITDKQVWQTFVEAHAPRSGAFLHDWKYGEMGARRFGVYERDELVSVAMTSVVQLPLGLSYALIERGPLVRKGVDLGAVVRAIKEEAGVIFVRFEPLLPLLLSAGGGSAFGGKEGLGVVIKKTVHVSPEETLILDLSKSEEEILSAMHPKTRYNIRLSQKKGVVVRELRRDERELAWKLFEETAKRDRFRLHVFARYEAWLETFPGAHLVGAFLGDELLAVNLMVDAFGTRTYLHGASSSKHRDVMAPYALHWHEIVSAKRSELSLYDFWGISNKNPAWAGITRFKLGFGGERIHYPGTFDLYRSYGSYTTYRFLRFMRRLF